MVIYVDVSVLVAHLLTEDRRPPADFWSRPLASSRLLQYEAWTRIHNQGVAARASDVLDELLGRVLFLEMDPAILGRAKEPFPVRVRTLDALHLASADFLRSQGQDVRMATYDRRLGAAAEALGFALYPMEADSAD